MWQINEVRLYDLFRRIETTCVFKMTNGEYGG